MEYHFLFRFIMVGNCSVGKSCLIRRLELDEFSESIGPTLNIEFVRKTLAIEGETIMVQVWDTSGNEQMHSLTANYFKSACGVLLVYDITNRKSFAELDRWLALIRDNAAEDCQMLLIGNKIDLEARRQVSAAEGLAFAKASGMQFIETSAKTAVNVVEAFKKLTVMVHHSVSSQPEEVIAEMKGVRLGTLTRGESTLDNLRDMLDGGAQNPAAKSGGCCG